MGKTYKNSVELEADINLKARKNFVSIRKKTESVNSYNLRVSEEFKIDRSVKYYKIYYKCSHSLPPADRKGCENKSKKNTRSFFTNCPFNISARYNRFRECFEIYKINYNHRGHSVDELTFKNIYSKNRKLSEKTRDYLAEISQFKPNTECIKEYLTINEPDKIILNKDVQNILQKSKRLKLDTNLELWEELEIIKKKHLEIKGNYFFLDIAEDKILESCMVFSKKSLDLFSKNNKVLLIDGTHRNNKHRYPVYIFMAEDSLSLGRIIAFAFIRNEQKKTLENIFRKFLEVTKICPLTVVIDKDLNEISAIKDVWGNINVKICAVHCIRAIWNAFPKFKLSMHDKNNIAGIFRSMVFQILDKKDYDRKYRQLVDECPDKGFIEYFDKNWNNISEKWAGYGLKNTVTYGNQSNNRIESKNQKIKLKTDRSSNLASAVSKMIDFLRSEYKELDYKLHYLNNTNVIRKDENTSKISKILEDNCGPIIVKKFKDNLNYSHPIKILETIEENIILEENNINVIVDKSQKKCNCRFYVLNTIPCRHIDLAVEKGYINYAASDIDNQWLIKNSKDTLVICNPRK